MKTEVYIEDQLADLTDDIAALFNYSIDDVKDFSSRDTGFSRTIVFPGTATNNRLFGHAFEFTAYNPYNPVLPNINSNFNAAKSAKCRVLVHGIQVFKGVLRLLEIKMLEGFVEYETAMFGELGGLISAIGNRFLTGNTDTSGNLTTADDLDFSDYNQDWNFANIINSWATHDSTGGGSGVYYPLIDYGLCTTDRINFSYQSCRPALYVKEYIEKIFEKAGYSFTCPFFSTAFFKRLIVPHNEDKVYKMVEQLVDHRSMLVTNFLTAAGSKNINFSTIVELNNFTATYSTSAAGSQFTFAGSATENMVLSSRVVLTSQGGQGAVQIRVELNVNSVAQDFQTFILNGIGAGSGPEDVWDFNLDTAAMPIAPGDVITVRIIATIGIAPTNPWYITVHQASRITVNAQTQQSAVANYNDPLSINRLIPKGVLQKDFLMSIVKMFNLRVVEDAQTDKHVIITPYIDFFDNTDPIDWSAKLDRSKGISLKPMSEVNARFFNFLYEKDSDYDNETYFGRYGKGYADRTYDAGLDFVKDKMDLKIIFGASPLVGVAGLDKAVTRIMKLNSGNEERTASKIRILQAKRIGVSSWNMLQDDLTTVINNHTWYGYAGHIDDPGLPQGADLNFGAPAEIYWTPANPYLPATIGNVFYSPYLFEITDKDSKLLTAFFAVTPLDIINLDFSKAILVDGQLWRLNKIADFDTVQEDSTKCELLKVIKLSYA